MSFAPTYYHLFSLPAKNAFTFITFAHLHLGEMLSGGGFKDHSLRGHPSGSRSSACQKTMQVLFPRKIRLPSSGGSCVGVHVMGCGRDTALCDLNALVF